MEALTSRSNKVLQLLQVHSRSFSVSSLLILPQHEQSFDDGMQIWKQLKNTLMNNSSLTSHTLNG